MKPLLLIVLAIFSFIHKTEAQQNWASVPCFSLLEGDQIGRLLNNTAHNEIIIVPSYGPKICNSTYKGFFAYNGITFHDMDLGIEAQNPNPYVGSVLINDCAEWKGKEIITGGFLTVGSDTLYSRSIAVWNGTVWDTFPHPFFKNAATPNVYVGFSKLLKDNGKLWMFGAKDTLGTFTQKPVLYDGTTFTPIPPIPVNNPGAVTEAIIYKNKLVVSGNFYDSPSFNYFRLAQFDGTSWSQIGTGVRGGLSAVQNIAIYDDTLYIAGAFPKAAGNAGNYLMKWDGNQLTDAGFSNIFCGYGAIWKLLNYRNRLYAFGGINCAAGKKGFGVAYYEKGKWTVPQDSIEGTGIGDAVVYNDAIYIGGSFKSINGDTTIKKFAKLLCPDFDAATGCLSGLKDNYKNRLNLKVFPNPATNKLFIDADYKVKIKQLSISNALGEVVLTVINPENKLTLDISSLSSGIYFLKAENELGQSVFKVVKE